MTVTVLFELRIKPDAVPAARDLMHRTLEVTRASTEISASKYSSMRRRSALDDVPTLGHGRARRGLPELSCRRRKSNGTPATVGRSPFKTRYVTSDIL